MALEAALVLVFLLLPGVVADGVYRFLTWRPDPSDQGLLVRATAISFGALFLLLVLQTAAPGVFVIPGYLEPAWWRTAADGEGLAWRDVVAGWLQHAAVALAGAIAVGLAVKSPRLTRWLQRRLEGHRPPPAHVVRCGDGNL